MLAVRRRGFGSSVKQGRNPSNVDGCLAGAPSTLTCKLIEFGNLETVFPIRRAPVRSCDLYQFGFFGSVATKKTTVVGGSAEGCPTLVASSE